jgi:hypothetical protein
MRDVHDSSLSRMATAHINYLEVISVNLCNQVVASDASCRSSGYREKIMIWLMQKNIIGNVYVSSMWFAYFLVFDFIQDMAAT